MTTNHKVPAGAPTAADLAYWIPMFREMRGWTQEELEGQSGVTVRTIQRVENGNGANYKTRRALAEAFGFPDIDALNKPIIPPSDEELKAIQERATNLVQLTAQALATGEQLCRLAEECSADVSQPAPAMPRPAAEAFASLIDEVRGYRDVSDDLGELQKLGIHDQLQTHINTLSAHGYSLRYATRKVQLTAGAMAPDEPPISATVLYLSAFEGKHQPGCFLAPKNF
jgi:transcriptional regulator with XRE-family HTH domain